MLQNFVAFPVLLILSILQISAISRIELFSGTADLILIAIAAWGVRERGKDVLIWALIGGLIISFVSAAPLFTPLIPYLFVAIVARLFQSRLWQSPILSLVGIVFIGTVFQHIFYILVFQINGMSLGFIESMQSVTLPSLLLNYFFLFPTYALISEIGKWMFPEENYE